MRSADISRQELAECLKGLREERGMILEDLAKKTGSSAAHLSRIENGKADVNARELQSILAAYHLRPVEQKKVMRVLFRSRAPVEEFFDTLYEPKKDVRYLLQVIAGLPEAVSEDDLAFLLAQQKNYRQVMNPDLILGMVK